MNFYNKASGTHKRYIFSFCIHKYYVQVSAVVYTSIHLFVLALILGMFISQGTNSITAKMEMFVCTMHCTMYISLPDYLLHNLYRSFNTLFFSSYLEISVLYHLYRIDNIRSKLIFFFLFCSFTIFHKINHIIDDLDGRVELLNCKSSKNTSRSAFHNF